MLYLQTSPLSRNYWCRQSYTCPSRENMSWETILKKGANCTVKVDGGNIEEYFLNKKLLAAAQYSISLKGDEIVKITPA